MATSNGSVRSLQVALNSARQLADDTNSLRAQFIEAQLGLALTFCQVASDSAGHSQRRSRNIQNARAAYKSALEAAERVMPTARQRSAIENLRTQVEARLAALGSLDGASESRDGVSGDASSVTWTRGVQDG
jgi:hypothetical protein